MRAVYGKLKNKYNNYYKFKPAHDASSDRELYESQHTAHHILTYKVIDE